MMSFPMSEYWWLYTAFIAFVGFLVAFDLGMISNAKKNLTTKQALVWSCVWIVLGLLVGVAIWRYSIFKFGSAVGNELGLQYLSGLLIEKALAIDNIFVFVLIFKTLGIPQHLQKVVLGYGILGALVFRAIFISIGAVLIKYQFMLYIFGAFLILTGIKMAIPKESVEDLESSWMFRQLKKVLPMTTDMSDGKFWIQKEGIRYFTPLFLALLLIEFSDIIFAIDSVPAIFAITDEPFIVFTSNMMAILGLRSLYLVLADAVHRFEYLKYGLAFILVFVGLKMVWLNQLYGGHFPIGLSLGIIGLALLVSVLASWFVAEKKGS